jgi:hypothetical protein
MRKYINIVEAALSKMVDYAKTIGVKLDIRYDDGDIIIDYIQNNGIKGAGARVINEICRYADNNRITIWLAVLEADPKLIKYYANFGFIIDSLDEPEPTMYREPILI